MDPSSGGAESTSVLFVCLGNICRSPLAEGVFKHLLDDEGIADRFRVDSAGTGAWHVGEPPDGRACLVASDHGFDLDCRARQVTEEDLRDFDVVVAMDHENLRALERMAEATGSEVALHLLREFDSQNGSDEVPDPYYGGPSGFESVYQMIRRSCEGLLHHLRAASRTA